MSGGGFYLRIGALFVLATIVGLIVRFALGAQGYRLYAWAAAVLVILPFLSRFMAERLGILGLRPRRRFWLLVPLFLIAVFRIGFWAVFFSSPQNATMMHIIDSQTRYYAGNAVYAPYLIVVLIGAYFLWRLGPWGERRQRVAARA